MYPEWETTDIFCLPQIFGRKYRIFLMYSRYRIMVKDVMFVHALSFSSYGGILQKNLVEKWYGIMKILIAEDYSDTAMTYEYGLDDRGHKVTLTSDVEEFLKVYHKELDRVTRHSDPTERIQPFDVVILDYKMPKMDGLEVAKEIFAINPDQRIIFASEYLRDIP